MHNIEILTVAYTIHQEMQQHLLYMPIIYSFFCLFILDNYIVRKKKMSSKNDFTVFVCFVCSPYNIHHHKVIPDDIDSSYGMFQLISQFGSFICLGIVRVAKNGRGIVWDGKNTGGELCRRGSVRDFIPLTLVHHRNQLIW